MWIKRIAAVACAILLGVTFGLFGGCGSKVVQTEQESIDERLEGLSPEELEQVQKTMEGMGESGALQAQDDMEEGGGQ